MSTVTASAPGKVILFGEHAVVYGRPAVAVPVTQVQAQVEVKARPGYPDGEVIILAPDIGLESSLADLPSDHPLVVALHAVLAALDVQIPPACQVQINSTIPLASGLGSGTAVSVALIRAFSRFLGNDLSVEQVSALAFEVEKIHHGTPSGVDNTVVAYALPVYFIKGQPPQTFQVSRPFTLVIGDTGVASPTAISVAEVRRAWQDTPAIYESYFDAIGGIVDSARQAIEAGAEEVLGLLMDTNHGVLQKMDVSSPQLEALVKAARQAGAWGAKLSGGGRGGNMIALVSPDRADKVAMALRRAGATRTIITQIG